MLFAGVKNIRELDERLESNKAIITAIKNNIHLWLKRLLELVETKRQNSNEASAPAKASRAGMRSAQDDDDDFPHSFKGGY